MTSETLTEVIQRIVDALDDGRHQGIGPGGAPIHVPPMDARPMGTPAIIVEVPELLDYLGTVGDCPQYEWRAEVLVVGSTTMGVDLSQFVDAVLAALHAAAYRVASGAYVSWQPPDSPSPFPAYTLTLE